MDDISLYIEPFRQLINISPISYRVGRGHTQMTPGNIFYRFKDFLPEDKLKTAALLNLLICLEQCDFCFNCFLKERKQTIQKLLSLCSVTLISEPDVSTKFQAFLLNSKQFNHTAKKIIYEAEPVPGLFMVQHALLLDEDSMSIINNQGELYFRSSIYLLIHGLG